MLNILIVEDEHAIANLIYINLSDEGYSHENAIKRETERALNQYQYDKFIVQADLITNETRITPETFRRLSTDLNGLAAFFAEDKSLLYSRHALSKDTPVRTGKGRGVVHFKRGPAP